MTKPPIIQFVSWKDWRLPRWPRLDAWLERNEQGLLVGVGIGILGGIVAMLIAAKMEGVL